MCERERERERKRKRERQLPKEKQAAVNDGDDDDGTSQHNVRTNQPTKALVIRHSPFVIRCRRCRRLYLSSYYDIGSKLTQQTAVVAFKQQMLLCTTALGFHQLLLYKMTRRRKENR